MTNAILPNNDMETAFILLAKISPRLHPIAICMAMGVARGGVGGRGGMRAPL
jgi:hypothetical protein